MQGDWLHQDGAYPRPVCAQNVGENLVAHHGAMFRRHALLGHRLSVARRFRLAGMAQIGNVQRPGEVCGPPGLTAVGQQEQGNPVAGQVIFPRF